MVLQDEYVRLCSYMRRLCCCWQFIALIIRNEAISASRALLCICHSGHWAGASPRLLYIFAHRPVPPCAPPCACAETREYHESFKTILSKCSSRMARLKVCATLAVASSAGSPGARGKKARTTQHCLENQLCQHQIKPWAVYTLLLQSTATTRPC
jgi:hypothetical protein